MTAPAWLPVEIFRQWAHDDVPDDDNLVDQAIAAGQQLLEKEAGRTLTPASGTSSARSFRPDGYTDLLWINDCDSITSIVENGVTLVAGTDYQAEPLNQIDSDTGDYRPYDRLRRLNAAWYRNGHQATVVATCDWGWASASIPPIVVEATQVLAKDWLGHRIVNLGVVGSTADGFSIGIRQSPTVRRAVNTIKHPLKWGI